MAANDPQQKYVQGTTGGVSITFDRAVYEVTVTASNFSSSGAVAYIELNGVPAAAAAADDRYSLRTGEARNITGKIRSIGIRMTAGTADIEATGYETAQHDVGKT